MTNRAIRVSEEEYDWLKKRRTGRQVPPEKQVQEDLKRKKAESETAEAKKKYDAVVRVLQESEDRLGKVLDVADLLSSSSPTQIEVKSDGKPSESTAVIVASDWHLEETVSSDTVDGLNEYNLDIAKARISKFFQNGLALVDMARSRSNIGTLILALAGDHITGFLHPELVESNSLSPTESLLEVINLASSGIDFLLKEGKFKKIVIPCNFGNHGRTTEKPRVSTAAKNSYEWLGFQFLRQKYQDNPRVHFQIANGYFNYTKVYDTTIRFHHGDGLKYGGGVGGVTIPLNKAIAQWNKGRHANVDCLGHWHERSAGRNFVINGSVIGYNAYSIKIKASYEPPCQSFFLVHPERGKTLEAPIFLS